MGIQWVLVIVLVVGGNGRVTPRVGEKSAWFGRAIAGMGDLDEDGAGDYIISAPREKQEGDSPGIRGVVRGYSGASGEVLFAQFGIGGFGDSLAWLGDVDGDGLSDFAAGGEAGVYVCSGDGGRFIYSKVDGPWAGKVSVASVDDVTGDGIRDLVCGWPNDAFIPGRGRVTSRVEVLDGTTGDLVARIDNETIRLGKELPFVAHIGGKVWGLGDLDGDGRGEIAFTTSDPQTGGVSSSICIARGFDGGSIFTITPGRPSREGGLSISQLGDWNGDGHVDLVVGSGATQYNNLSRINSDEKFRKAWEQPLGQVVIHSGLDGRSLSSLELEGRTPRFGHAFAGGADFDGDGTADLLVSDYGWFAFMGACCVYSGKDGRLLRQQGRAGTHDYGAALAVIDDLDGDGVSDFAVGAMNDDPMSYMHGAVVVYSGRTGQELYRLPKGE